MRIKDIPSFLKGFSPKIGIVLGSGLGGAVAQMDAVCEIAYADIEGFPIPRVSGHDGKFLFGNIAGAAVVAMCGRIHYYEGYSAEQIVLPIRAMRDLGAETLLLTNVSGAINTDFRPGEAMRITDQIMLAPNPLIGKNNDRYGERFPDMTEIYDHRLGELIETCAAECGIAMRRGVYIQTTGPSYETPAEIKMFRLLGADAVGMSTACEAIVARHCGMRVGGIACISNFAAGMGGKLSHEEVRSGGLGMAGELGKLIFAICKALN